MHDGGNRAHGRYLALYVLPNERAFSRLGVSASRRLGPAVRRNRAKRVVRAVFREHKPPYAVDLVAIVKAPLLDAEFASVVADYQIALKRALGDATRRSPAARTSTSSS